MSDMVDMVVDENSTDLDALREELQFELIVLHGEVKTLNKDWDFTAIVNKLVADVGPPLNTIPRIKKQIELMKKLKEDFLRKARDLQRPAVPLAQAAQSFYVAEFPDTKESKPVKPCKNQRRRQPPDIDIDEVLPSWGECKRYSRSMDQKQYTSLVAIARQIYDIILLSASPCKCSIRVLDRHLLSAITNRWLGFHNIKEAALLKNFSLVQIGYHRNEDLLAAKAAKDPARKAFALFAIDYLRNSNTKRKITRELLFAAWSAHGGQPHAKIFFTAAVGTPLSMQELWSKAFPDGLGRRPAPAADGLEDDSEPGGVGGADSDLNLDDGQSPQDDATVGAAAASGRAVGRGGGGGAASSSPAGQSVEAVAWAREGGNALVYDAQGQEAAAPYQPRKLNQRLAAPDSGTDEVAAAATAGGGPVSAREETAEAKSREEEAEKEKEAIRRGSLGGGASTADAASSVARARIAIELSIAEAKAEKEAEAKEKAEAKAKEEKEKAEAKEAAKNEEARKEAGAKAKEEEVEKEKARKELEAKAKEEKEKAEAKAWRRRRRRRNRRPRRRRQRRRWRWRRR